MDNSNNKEVKINKVSPSNKSELIDMALNIIQKNESLEKLSRKIEFFRANPKFETCYKEIFELQNMIRETLQLDKERDTFQLYINKNNELFYNSLRKKYPKLTTNETRLCALIRLGLHSKEIASILNISSKSVEMNRYRLSKKIQLSGSFNLSEFIRNI